MLNLLIGDTGIYLRSLDIRVTEHLTHAFHRYALAERHRRKGVSGKVENIIHLRNWKNIENKPVTGCELVDFLYFTSVAEKQSGMEY